MEQAIINSFWQLFNNENAIKSFWSQYMLKCIYFVLLKAPLKRHTIFDSHNCEKKGYVEANDAVNRK